VVVVGWSHSQQYLKVFLRDTESHKESFLRQSILFSTSGAEKLGLEVQHNNDEDWAQGPVWEDSAFQKYSRVVK
jgi:hypothetical protein